MYDSILLFQSLDYQMTIVTLHIVAANGEIPFCRIDSVVKITHIVSFSTMGYDNDHEINLYPMAHYRYGSIQPD